MYRLGSLKSCMILGLPKHHHHNPVRCVDLGLKSIAWLLTALHFWTLAPYLVNPNPILYYNKNDFYTSGKDSILL